MQQEIELPLTQRLFAYHGLSIYLDKILLKFLEEMPDDICAYTHVTHAALFHTNAIDKTLVGSIQIIFRNQGEVKHSGVMALATLSAKGKTDVREAEMFSIVLQFLFDRVKGYIEKEKELDSSGNLFILPQYLYSPEDFSGTFPD